ncbi:hypothetical protein ZHAS_00016463 [Anopheles sinensis]|uniref:Uncharacterized protein n=1 Tax=Anopheles sinensis TaxID=74873 RepID=A0A084WE33_ANOSI|nr:hypothetical protein ZHAS_00016463 [Anopheles sinensis]
MEVFSTCPTCVFTDTAHTDILGGAKRSKHNCTIVGTTAGDQGVGASERNHQFIKAMHLAPWETVVTFPVLYSRRSA